MSLLNSLPLALALAYGCAFGAPAASDVAATLPLQVSTLATPEQAAIDYPAMLDRFPDPLNKLIAAKSAEAGYARTYGARLQTPAFAAFNDVRRSGREEALIKATPTLVAAIEQIDRPSAIEGFVNRYVMPADLESLAAVELNVAMALRRQALAPFHGIENAEYLNAIYTGVDEEIDETEPLVVYTRTRTRPLSMRFGRPVYSLDHSMILPVMHRVLMGYQRHWGECLRRDAQTIDFRSAQALPPDHPHRPHKAGGIRVNPEFVPVLKRLRQLDPSRTMNAESDDVTIERTKLMAATDTMMIRYACTDPRLQRFERNMGRFFNERAGPLR